jgi:hypothetical protein
MRRSQMRQTLKLRKSRITHPHLVNSLRARFLKKDSPSFKKKKDREKKKGKKKVRYVLFLVKY